MEDKDKDKDKEKQPQQKQPSKNSKLETQVSTNFFQFNNKRYLFTKHAPQQLLDNLALFSLFQIEIRKYRYQLTDGHIFFDNLTKLKKDEFITKSNIFIAVLNNFSLSLFTINEDDFSLDETILEDPLKLKKLLLLENKYQKKIQQEIKLLSDSVNILVNLTKKEKQDDSVKVQWNLSIKKIAELENWLIEPLNYFPKINKLLAQQKEKILIIQIQKRELKKQDKHRRTDKNDEILELIYGKNKKNEEI